jgi:hypothetical protein
MKNTTVWVLTSMEFNHCSGVLPGTRYYLVFFGFIIGNGQVPKTSGPPHLVQVQPAAANVFASSSSGRLSFKGQLRQLQVKTDK